MKDSYSLDADWEGLDTQYRAHYQAYFNIFHRCHLPVIAVQSDVGMMGGQLAHEYMYLALLARIRWCCATPVVARQPPGGTGANRPPHLRHHCRWSAWPPGTATIDDLAAYLGVPTSRTAKAVFFVATVADPADANATRQQFVFAVVRGDTDLNETKLVNALGSA